MIRTSGVCLLGPLLHDTLKPTAVESLVLVRESEVAESHSGMCGGYDLESTNLVHVPMGYCTTQVMFGEYEVYPYQSSMMPHPPSCSE